VHTHCNNHTSCTSNASSCGVWFTCRNSQTRLAAEVFSLQLSVSLLSHLNLFFWSLAPTLQSVTRHGAADTSRWKQSNGSSESWRSTVPPSIQAAFTLGTRVLWSAAFTASETASNRLPPHSKIYKQEIMWFVGTTTKVMAIILLATITLAISCILDLLLRFNPYSDKENKT
jgi:hypothetical protein